MLPKISIVIPARDEEQVLPTCFAAIDRARNKINNPVEVVVVLNRCTDNTERLAVEYGATVVREDAKNLSAIRNSGIKAATGQIVVTIDADSFMSESLLLRVAQELESESIIGGGVFMMPSRLSLGIFLTGLCILPVILYHRISGGVFFARKVDIEAIGGFDENLSSAEDIDFARRLKIYGRKSQRRFRNLYTAHIVTSTRKFDRLGDWYFIKNLRLIGTLLKGRNQAAADKIWYDFKR